MSVPQYGTVKLIAAYNVTTTADDIRRCCDKCRSLPLMTTNDPFISIGDRERLVIEMTKLDVVLLQLQLVLRGAQRDGLSVSLLAVETTFEMLMESVWFAVDAVSGLHRFATSSLLRAERPSGSQSFRHDLQCVLNHADVVLPLLETVIQAENEWLSNE